uniref:(northern house mosquito) hypothetical protein n=1 Tax=Culex pipiens TaxID=7175 RepID=A0A8D8A0M7_CULPI
MFQHAPAFLDTLDPHYPDVAMNVRAMSNVETRSFVPSLNAQMLALSVVKEPRVHVLPIIVQCASVQKGTLEVRIPSAVPNATEIVIVPRQGRRVFMACAKIRATVLVASMRTATCAD